MKVVVKRWTLLRGRTMSPWLWLFVGFMLLPAFLSTVPRTTIPFQEVDQWVQRFSIDGVTNYSVFLVNPFLRNLFIGAKDCVISLNLDSHEMRKVPWEVSNTDHVSCEQKGKKPFECHNYIRILEYVNHTHIYVCGTHAFNPYCGLINVVDFHDVRHNESGRGKCPFDATQPYTAVMADGILYAATVSNFLGTEPIISRTTGNAEERIRTDTSVAWLNDPSFISSAYLQESKTGDNDKIYFFFTERAREYDFYTKVKVSRVARVCKGDVGGQKTLQKRWTTFLKAQLICSDPESGIHFNILKDMFTMHTANWNSTVFYGIFSSHWDGGEVSAVCAYGILDIHSALNGPFKGFKRDCEKWSKVMDSEVPSPRPGSCVTESMKAAGIQSSLNLPDRVLTFVRDHPLMDQNVHPLRNQPMLVKLDTQYRKIAVQKVKSVSGKEYEVLYLGTARGHLQKAVRIGLKTLILEDLPLFAEAQPIHNLQLHENWIFAGSPSEVTQVNMSNCERHRSCEQCILARDPSCAWSVTQSACIEHREEPRLLQDIEDGNALGLCIDVEVEPDMMEMPVMLGARVVLPCIPLSSWYSCKWTKPSTESSDYVWRRDGLEFTVTEQNLGHYKCHCTENGIGGLVAAYSVVGSSGTTSSQTAAPRTYTILTSILLFLFGFLSGGVLYYICERRLERRNLINKAKSGLDLIQSNTTSCSHEPHTPSSPEDERHPLAADKKNGGLNGFSHYYISDYDKDQARIIFPGAPIAKCDETSI
ncbi:semaphorin-4F isoform X2 [Microcaecilia unicolor]|uniref:Semaphorin-4F isoform X2 n=1 Tax=Microcaecilia unicolor TaxID=1415580 RepID=A0A6P7X007_9AMPH|nr:semaphorin-4F isoform X2 [Microcaecilia unicolor]